MTVSLKDVNFSYDDVPVLKRLNLDVQAGDCLVLCGMSGCGKTTVTRLLNGLIPELFEGTLTGETSVLEINTQTAPIYALATQVGSVFQNPKTQFFTVDVLSELAFGCENQGMPQAEILSRIEQVAELFDITHLLKREMFDLSGGEKQLVALASAYMVQPNVLVLDEVSSNLDFGAIEKITSILHKVKEQGCTIIIAEHRLYYLAELADHYLLVENGEISAHYTPAEFNALSPSERQAVGLRVQQLDMVVPDLPQLNTTESKEILDLKKVSVTYPKQKKPALVLEDIQFSAGNAVGIMGHNGAGKTSLGKAITGLLADKQDMIFLAGKKLSPKERMGQSFLVMQDVNYQLFCETVEKELRLKIGSPEHFDDVVTQLNLADILHRHPLSLSGGQKQRVAIASAILSGKKIIVLDEPTSGLDYYHMKQVSQAVAYLRQLGIFVFIISHDLEFIALTCNQILVLKEGLASGFYEVDKNDVSSLVELMKEVV